MSPIQNNLANFVAYMTKPDAMAPIIALEATVTGGRTIQAYKRGGEDEARERLIEETTGAVVWLCGVKVLNSIGDKILAKIFGANFDVGTDKILRTPFENFIKKNPPKTLKPQHVALIKAIKVLASVAIADIFIGLIVPPLNQKLTRSIANKKAEELESAGMTDKLELSSKSDKEVKNPTFKGASALSAINMFTNAIENTNTGKLLSTDAGLVTGRMYSARNNQERKEIAIRDIGSIYFYMWAQGHVAKLLNYIETGRFSRLNPTSANILDEQLKNMLELNGGELSVDKFRDMVLGKNPSDIKLPDNIKFETGELGFFTKLGDKFSTNKTEPLQVAKVSDLKDVFKDKKLFARIEQMSKLQPLRQGEAVITKQQIIDAMNDALINDYYLLDKVFDTYTEGAYKNEYRYVSNETLTGLKSQMENYVKDICKSAKDGKINKEVLNKAKNKNLTFSGINFVAGFLVAAAFLSTLIPKIQYWYTRHTTGRNEFPGTYGLKEEAKEYAITHNKA